MLQHSTNPPQIVGSLRASETIAADDYATIDARIQPLDIEPANALACEIEHLIATGNFLALCALYDGYIAAAEAMRAIVNQPRADIIEDFLEEERNRLMSKAYLVGDCMQHMKPQRFEHNEFCRVLFDCAIQMGNNVNDAIAVIRDVPKPEFQVAP
jgi:hypothetical protein